MSNNRPELHLHTSMSETDGVGVVLDYVRSALEKGLTAIAITDHASLQAYPEAYSIARKLNIDVKIIYGAEIYLSEDGSDKIYHSTVLARSNTGIKNLYRLVSLANGRISDGVPVTLKIELDKYRKGLLIGSGCDRGEIYGAIKDGKSDDEILSLMSFYDYIEIVPEENFKYFTKSGFAQSIDDLREINRKITVLGKECDKPVVAVSDAHYPYADYDICRKILLRYKKRGSCKNPPELSMKTTGEMLELFSYLGEKEAEEIVIENPDVLVGMIDEGIVPIDQEAEYNADTDEFINNIYMIAYKKYGGRLSSVIKNRLDFELSQICKSERNTYALIVCGELVKRARSDGYTVGNMGGIASSFVAYLLGITEINPLEAHYLCPKCRITEFHGEFNCGADMARRKCERCGVEYIRDGFNIPPETFFGIDKRGDLDIELSVAEEYRERAISHLEDITGAGAVRCGMIRTLPDMPVKCIINKYETASRKKLPKNYYDAIVKKLREVKMSDRVHPGGVFLLPKDKEVYDYTPVQYSEKDGKTAYTHFDHRDLPQLLKINILASDEPSMIKKLEGLTKYSSRLITYGDEKTLKLFKDGGTSFIPGFSEETVKNEIIPRAGVDSLDALIRIYGLSHGTNVWTGNAGKLIDAGYKLRNAVCFRDDILLYLLKLGYKRDKAYEISEMVGKGKEIPADLYCELKSRGADPMILFSWEKLKYLFPRAHAATATLFAYRIAYYKAHFPLEFYCACFNMNLSDFDAGLIINDADSINENIKKAHNNSNDHYVPEAKLKLMELAAEMYNKGYSFDTDGMIPENIRGFEISGEKIKPKST